MMQDTFGWLAPLKSVPEGGEGQAGVKRRRTGPADHATAPGIKDRGQEQPAFGGSEVGYVGYAAGGITDIMPAPGLCRVGVPAPRQEAVADAA